MTTTDIKQIEADSLEGIERVDETFNELYNELKRIREEKKRTTAEEDAAKELIREWMMEKHAKKVTFEGKDLATLASVSSRSFDYKLAESELGVEVVARFVTNKTTTRLNIK